MMDFIKIKKYLIYALVGCLIASALVAVYAVLFKSFNDVTGKIFLTLLTAFIHSLVSLLFIWNDERSKNINRLTFAINTIFVIVILSFITNLFGIWDLIKGETIAKLYLTYIILFFSALHMDILSKASSKEKYIDYIVFANYIFIALVVLMLQPIIYIKNSQTVLGEFYYRVLGATGIIDATLSILTIIFYRLYMHKHPELQIQKEDTVKGGFSIFRVLFWIIMTPFILIAFFALIGLITNYFR